MGSPSAAGGFTFKSVQASKPHVEVADSGRPVRDSPQLGVKRNHGSLGKSGHVQGSPEASRELDDMGLREVLEHDPRPTFVIDLHPGLAKPPVAALLEPVFCNSSSQSHPGFSNLLSGRADHDSTRVPGTLSYTDFKSWAQDVHEQEGANHPTVSSISYGNISWTRFTVRQRWRVISGSGDSTPGANITAGKIFAPGTVLETEQTQRIKPQPDTSTSAVTFDNGISYITSYVQTSGTPDWTAPQPLGELTPHLQFARSVDWAATPLGAISTWSREFRQIANLVMSNPHPCAVFWGDELTAMYNNAYGQGIAGEKHPGLMGTGLSGPFKEIWSSIEGMFAECRRTGKAVAVANQMLSMERHGFLEETSFSWTLTPLYGGGPNIIGFYNAPFETTWQIVNDRRSRTLLRLGEEVALAQNISSFWNRVLKGIEGNEFDFPFALLYSASDDLDLDGESSTSSKRSNAMRYYVLKGALGVPEGHMAAPTCIDMDCTQDGFGVACRDALRAGEPSVIRTMDGSLSESLIEGFQWRGFGDPCREAIVCPIRPTTDENVLGFLVVGINPRRPYDEDYQLFIRLLHRQLAASLASVTLLEEEIRRGHTAAEAAALERLRLSKELAVQKSRLQRIAEVSPVGMFYIDPNGLLLEANDRWYAITGHPKHAMRELSWMDVIDDSSLPVMEDGWHRLAVDCLPWSAELKLKKPWQDPVTGDFLDHWILAESQPEFSEDGSIRSIMGAITDITTQKRSAEDALARARLSEQLLLRTQEAKENEKNFKRFSDLAPGGLVIMDADGKITYANSQWFEISGHPNDRSVSAAPLSWTKAISKEDLAHFASKWEEMKTKHVTITIEVRMQKPWDGQLGGTLVRKQRWILASLFPEASEDGVLMSVMGCITDISQMKWAEGVQIRRLEEAEEIRRQQNNFIDITSHEMRNPLSAIIQCADGISSALSEYQSASISKNTEMVEAIQSSIENAETILLCAQHQKSVVDDILTVSKLDSDLLHIAPVAIQPVEVVRRALKMFDSELQVNDIKMKFHVDDSLQKLQVDRVMLDSSRILQILINLLTNAIKFTKSAAKRSIVVSICAYLNPPSDTEDSFDYIPAKNTRLETTLGDEWGSGDVIYLRFEVRDTGCGLTPDEKKMLFIRFSQASPRTHVQYGGSGLGLFISRQLTELHGGEIGVASKAGVGSTFAFYVRSRKSDSDVDVTVANMQQQSGFQATSRRATNASKTLEARNIANSLHFATSASASASTSSAASGSPSSPVISDVLSTSKLPITPSSPNGYHILIVEDNLVNQKVSAAQIRKLGCIVHVANHGGEALTLLRETKFYKGREHDGRDLSVILMDLEMPVMDGLTCVRKIREMQAEGEIVGHVPIIAVTANARGEQIAAARDSGMDDVMPKPFRIRQLLQKIEGLLQTIKHGQ